MQRNIPINKRSTQSSIPNGKSHEGILIKTQNNSNGKLSRAEKAECIRLMSRLPRHTLGISPNTAARHIANIYRKLGISSVAEATNYAISAKLMIRGVKE